MIDRSNEVGRGQNMPRSLAPIDKMTGGDLRSIRKDMGLGTPRFARLIGAGASTVRQWESQDYLPLPTAILARILQVSREMRSYLLRERLGIDIDPDDW